MRTEANEDNVKYFHFTGPQRLDKAIHTLEGILIGMSGDGRVTNAELKVLSHWLAEHDKFIEQHPFNEIVPRLNEVMADGIVDTEEIADILWLCDRLSTDERYFNRVTSDMQRLQGIMRGICKRPRFSLRTLAIVVVIVACGVWWVNWPRRTGEAFVLLLIEGKADEVSQYMVTDQDREMVVRIAHAVKEEMEPDSERIRPERPPVSELKLTLHRSWSDILLGRATIYAIDTPIYIRRGRLTFDLEAQEK